MPRPGKTTGLYLSPAAQGYLAWAVRWLKTSQSGAVEEALRRFVEDRMCHYSVYTTWNAVARAVKNLPGNWDGLSLQEEDQEVLLTGLESPVTEQPILGWCELLIRNDYGQWESVQTLPDGRSTTLQDWLPPELAPLAARRHGVAVPVEVLAYIAPAE
ncbi:MAG: hypothetical protein ACPLRW_07235 [Moorellales bacterium]